MATKEFHWVASKREMEYDDVRCEVAGSCIVHMYRVSNSRRLHSLPSSTMYGCRCNTMRYLKTCISQC